jgi:EmrB/QacA subfamily drug resistance transporter
VIRAIAAFAIIVLGFFMALLDSTIVNISLPRMTEYFGTSMKTITWVVNGYNIAFAALLVTASRLADQFGRKKLFVFGVACFTAMSLCCGLSHSVNVLIFFRVMQGLSGAFIVPVSMPLMLDLFPSSRRGAIVGAWGAVAGVSAASGPALGGIITNYFSWQWIFYINLPLGIIAVIGTVFLIAESGDPTASRRIDWPGMITLSAGVFCLALALVQANDKGWGSAYILGTFAASALGLIAFVAIERSTPEPMLPLSLLLKSRPFSFAMAALFFSGIGLMCGVFFLSFFLTRVAEMSQLRAGIIITAIPLSAMVFSAVSGPFSDRFGSRWLAACGMAVVCASIWIFHDLSEKSTTIEIIWRLVLCGAGMGLSLPPIVGASIRAVPADKIGIASGIGNIARTIGAVVGVALLVMVLTRCVNHNLIVAKRQAEAIVAADPVLRQEAKEAIIGQLHATKFTQETRLPTRNDIIRQFEARRDAALASAASMQAAVIKAAYKKQIRQVEALFPQVKAVFMRQMARSFSQTFKVASLLLIVGILFGWWCEPARRRPAA